MIFSLGILPVIALALISGITAAVGGTIKAMPTKADNSRRARITDLESRRNLGTLGLSQKQIDELQSLGMAPVQAMERESLSRQGDLMMTQEQGAGASIIQRDLAKEATRKAARDVGLAVQRADIQEAQRQEAELAQLQAIQDARGKEKRAAVVQAGEGVASAIAQGMDQGDTASDEGVGGDTKKLGGSLGTQYGFASNASTAEARAAEYMSKFNVTEIEAAQLASLSPAQVEQLFLNYFNTGE